MREYQSLPQLAPRSASRLMRHPIVVPGIGLFWLFVLQHRRPVKLMRAGRRAAQFRLAVPRPTVR